MTSLIVVHPTFEATWPFVANHLYSLWQKQGEVKLIRLGDNDQRPLHEAVPDLMRVERLIALGVPATVETIQCLPTLREVALLREYGPQHDDSVSEKLKARGVRTYQQSSEGFWGPSVSEFGLALTLSALRRIPQTYAAMMCADDVWHYEPRDGKGRPGARGGQFGDDANFTNGTVEGKRVRIVGAGNIASRYASFMHMLGADVAVWDPFASEPVFHRAGSRREHHLDRLVRDADIFAPMVPLTDSTRGIVTCEHIYSLPKGCLVVLVTRALICDMSALRERVMADEIALAADVFDVEPLPLDDSLLGRHNVVHTPHNAGRTKEANFKWAEMLVEQFLPR